MSSANERIITLSKTKILLTVLGSCVFVGIGLWMVQMDPAHIATYRRFNNPSFIHGLGALTIIFCSLCTVFGVKKLFDSKPGLILSSAGMFDNTSGVSAGLIPWSDIIGFTVVEVHKTKTLVVNVTNPEKYVNKGGPLKRALNRIGFKMYGSPIQISSTTLKVGFNELHAVCNQYLDTYGKATRVFAAPPTPI